MTNYNLTTGADDDTLADDDTVTATAGTINPGDELTGTGSNDFILSGTGTFDLTIPAILTGFSTLDESGSGQTVVLKAGLPMAVIVGAGYGNETVTLASTGDGFVGGSSSGNEVVATSAILAGSPMIDGGSGGDNSLYITDSNAVVSLGDDNVTDFVSVILTGSDVTFNPGTAAGLNAVYLGGPGDTVSLNSSVNFAVDTSAGGNTVFLAASGNALYADMTPDGAPVTETVVGFDSSKTIYLQNLATLAGYTYTASNAAYGGANTLEVTGQTTGGTAIDDVFLLRGAFQTSDFALTPDPGGAATDGYDLTTSNAAPAAILTTGDDTVGSGVSWIVAGDGTLTSGDQIDPDAGATLDLVGAGTFDLTQPGQLTNIGQIIVESAGADVTLLSGLDIPVTLSAAGDDQITLADDGASIDANGGGGDTFYVTPDQAQNATITATPASPTVAGSTLLVNATGDNASQAVTIGSNVTGIQYLGLAGGSNSLNPGLNGPSLVYVYSELGAGNNTIELTGTTLAAIDYADDGTDNPDNFFFSPDQDGTLTLAYSGGPVQNAYGYNANQTIVLADFVGSGSVSASYDDSAAGAPQTLVTVTGTDSAGDAASQQFQLFGHYDTGAFSFNAGASGPNPTLTYSGAAPVNTFSQTGDDGAGGNHVSGVSDVYLASDQIGGGDTISTTPGGTLHLIGAGDFVLNNTASTITGVTTIEAVGPRQNITLDQNMAPLTVDIDSTRASGHDEFYNITDQTKIVGNDSGNNYGQTTSDQVDGLDVDFGSGGSNQIQIDDAGFSLTLDAPNVKHVESFSIQENAGISIDTGSYAAATGEPVNIDIAVGAGSTLGTDHVTLRGNGDSLSDFYGSDDLAMLGPNEVYTDLLNGATLDNVETITGFDQGASTGDTLSLPFPDQLTITPVVDRADGTTTLDLSGDQFGSPLTGSIVLEGIYDGTFTATPAPNFSNGFNVTYTPCYAAGTLIAVVGRSGGRRDVPVEKLRAGMTALLHGGETRPIVWIGRRRVNLLRHPRPELAHPIRIRKDALARCAPSRDLLVSPEHCIYAAGVLVPARLLVNGGSIVQDRGFETVEYFHVELDRHGLLLAEGLAAESYLDTGNRGTFDGDGPSPLHPEFVVQPGHARWSSDACAPLAVDPATVEPIWRRLSARSAELGFATSLPMTTSEPDIRLEADGVELRPSYAEGGRVLFVLGKTARTLRLLSRAARPCDAAPWLDDRRMLGVCVRRISVPEGATRRAIPLDGPLPEQGWHAPEASARGPCRWTDGAAELPYEGGIGLVEIELAGGMRYPAAEAGRAASAPAWNRKEAA